VLHLLHGWSDRDETTGHLRRRSTGRHHSAINRPSSAPFNIVREQHLPSSTLYLLRPHLRIYYLIYAPTTTSTTICIHRLLHSTPRTLLLDYSDHPLSRIIWNTPSRITH